MFLLDIALGLQHSHVISNGRRGHTQIVALHQSLRADRLLGSYVIRDNCPKNFLPALIRLR